MLKTTVNVSVNVNREFIGLTAQTNRRLNRPIISVRPFFLIVNAKIPTILDTLSLPVFGFSRL